MVYFFEGVGNELLFVVSSYIFIIVAFLVFRFLKFRPYVILTERLDDFWQTVGNVLIYDNSIRTSSNIVGNSDNAEDVRIYNTDCCVCLRDGHNYVVTSACGHCFCGVCGINLIIRTTTAMKCPLCRQECISLFIKHTDRGTAEIPHSDLVDAINSYNSRVEHRSSIKHIILNQIRNIPMMLRSIGDAFHMFRAQLVFNIHMAAAVVATFAYVLLSTDLIPDVAFGPLGFVDDFIIVITLLLYLIRYHSYHNSNQLLDLRTALDS